MIPAADISMLYGRRTLHEAYAANMVAERRRREGKPPASFVMDAWRNRQRIRRTMKERAAKACVKPGCSDTSNSVL